MQKLLPTPPLTLIQDLDTTRQLILVQTVQNASFSTAERVFRLIVPLRGDDSSAVDR